LVARSKARTVFDRSNRGIVLSNPTGGIEEYRCFSAHVLLCVGSALTTVDLPSKISYQMSENDLQFQKLIHNLNVPQKR
jgi:hypothetical protein